MIAQSTLPSTEQIALVRRSFALVQPIAREAAVLFYDNLFQADPNLRPLFRGDMAQQGERLMSMTRARPGSPSRASSAAA